MTPDELLRKEAAKWLRQAAKEQHAGQVLLEPEPSRSVFHSQQEKWDRPPGLSFRYAEEDRPGPDIGVKTSATGPPVGQPFRLRPGFQPGQSLRGLAGLARAEARPTFSRSVG